MTEDAGYSKEAAPRKVVGVPFKKGGDPRINVRGRPRGSTTQLLRSMLDEARDKTSSRTLRRAMLDNLIRIATQAGGAEAVAAAKLIWAYDEGQPVARNENAGAGDFADLSEVDTEQLVKALKLVK